MRIAICDDEKSIQQILDEKIKKILPKAVVEKFMSGDELLSSGNEPDILFLDIQMPGKDGMETARIFRQKNKKAILIFVTAVEEYVFQAFDVGAFHYLVKPFSDEKFEEVLKLAEGKIASTSADKPERANIMISMGGVHTKVCIEDIVYAEVFNRKIVIHTTEDSIEYYGKLTDLEDIVGEDFFRPHRAYLINMKYVEKYDASNIYLGKGQVLMAKQNYKRFVESYMKYSMKE